MSSTGVGGKAISISSCESKYYFYDSGQVTADDGIKLENIVACALQKELHLLEDTLGRRASLHYLRDKEGREIDFLVLIDDQPIVMVEVKWADSTLSRHFTGFAKCLPGTPGIQVVGRLEREKSFESGFSIVNAAPWLAGLRLENRGSGGTAATQ
jgi:predicted AAA+ superfamily ATPase